MTGNGNGQDTEAPVPLAEDPGPHVVLVLNREKLRAFVRALSHDWLGAQLEFYEQLVAAAEEP